MEEVQDHLNIVKLHEVIDYRYAVIERENEIERLRCSDRMFMVMSLAGGGDLLEEVLAYRTQHYGLPEVRRGEGERSRSGFVWRNRDRDQEYGVGTSACP